MGMTFCTFSMIYNDCVLTMMSDQQNGMNCEHEWSGSFVFSFRHGM